MYVNIRILHITRTYAACVQGYFCLCSYGSSLGFGFLSQWLLVIGMAWHGITGMVSQACRDVERYDDKHHQLIQSNPGIGKSNSPCKTDQVISWLPRTSATWPENK